LSSQARVADISALFPSAVQAFGRRLENVYLSKKIRMMNRMMILALALTWAARAPAQDDAIRLLVRVDDMGMSHAANAGILQSLLEGIGTSAEVMVVTPWLPQAVRMLRENPGIDAGLHLTLTSEWSDLKWRPLTSAPSLVDEWGYFYPFLWPNERAGQGRALREHDWKLEEIEAEFRAQIELAKRVIPNLTHVSGHMGCTNMAPEVAELTRRLCREYGLDIFPEDRGIQRFPGLGGARLSPEEKTLNFIANLEKLAPGTYMFVEHPAIDTPEQQAIGHPGYEEVAYDRMGVLKVLTDPRVKATIEKRGIQLISYADLK
jgi:predicted glycoside hydrolase/deacetylase ChbG (UPF0249 family)